MTLPLASPTSEAARARSGVAQPNTLKALDAKQRLLLEYVVHGCPHPYVSLHVFREEQSVDPQTGQITRNRIAVEPGVPLRVEEAAELVGIRKRYARRLISHPLAQRYMAQQVQALRDGHKAEAVHKQIDIMRDPGQGKAADRKVQLEATQIILGEAGSQRSPTVNVNVNTQVVTPGYVIRLPPKPEPRTIDAAPLNDIADEVQR